MSDSANPPRWRAPTVETKSASRAASQRPGPVERLGELVGALLLVLVVALYHLHLTSETRPAVEWRVLFGLSGAYVLILVLCYRVLPARVAPRIRRLAILAAHCVAVGVAIWLTGATGSPFLFLLHLLILGATFMTGVAGALFAAILCTLVFAIIVGFDSGTAALDASGSVRLIAIFSSLWVVAYLGWSMARSAADEKGRLREANKTLAAKLAESSLLYAFSHSLSSAASADRLASEALPQVARCARAEAARLFLYARESDEIVLAAATGLPDQAPADIRRQPVGPGSSGMAGRAAFTRESLFLSQLADEDPPASDACTSEACGLRSFLVEPLTARGELVGVVELLARAPAHLEQGELRLLRVLCNDFALSLDSARLSEETRDRARVERLVNRISARVQATLDVGTVLQTAAHEVCIAARASRCLIATPGDGGTLIVGQEYCRPEVGPVGVGQPPDAGVTGTAFRRAATEMIDDVAHARQLDEASRAALLAWDTGAVLAAPLAHRGRVLGVISLHECGRPRQWRAADAALLEAVAGQIAVGVENARLYQETRQQSDEIAAKNRELEAFVYTASHDLRAPLVTIQGFASILLKDCAAELGPEGRFYLERIRVNTFRLEHLMDDLLRLSRAGRAVGTFESVDVGQVAQEALEELQVPLSRRQVEVRVGDHWPQVPCDRERLVQVYTNLLSNALKFLGPANARPCIDLGWQEQGEFAEFYVRDNGIGIEPEYHERVFDIFQRLQDLPEVEGTGVGLAIVKRIIELHGGRVWVESARGEGATFRFTLPRRQEGAQ